MAVTAGKQPDGRRPREGRGWGSRREGPKDLHTSCSLVGGKELMEVNSEEENWETRTHAYLCTCIPVHMHTCVSLETRGNKREMLSVCQGLTEPTHGDGTITDAKVFLYLPMFPETPAVNITTLGICKTMKMQRHGALCITDVPPRRCPHSASRDRDTHQKQSLLRAPCHTSACSPPASLPSVGSRWPSPALGASTQCSAFLA